MNSVNSHNGYHNDSTINAVQGISYKSTSHTICLSKKNTGDKALTEGRNVIYANFQINYAMLKNMNTIWQTKRLQHGMRQVKLNFYVICY